jgi:hypothetical protein
LAAMNDELKILLEIDRAPASQELQGIENVIE